LEEGSTQVGFVLETQTIVPNVQWLFEARTTVLQNSVVADSKVKNHFPTFTMFYVAKPQDIRNISKLGILARQY